MTGQFVNVLSAEIDPYACLTYAHLYGENPQNDLTEESFKEKVEQIGYDVLLAGFPCQTFSQVGKKLGFEDKTKGTIFFHIAEIVRRSRPKGIFLENVENLVRHDHGRTFETILETLECELDYQVVGVSKLFSGDLSFSPKDFVRNTKNFGIPQNRPRTYIIAFDRKRYGHNEELETISLPTGRDEVIFEDLNGLLEMGADPQYYLAQGYWQTLINHRKRQLENGNNFGYRIVNEPGIPHPIANTILATGGSGRERNLVIDYQESIPGMAVQFKKTALNSDCVRFMTPREWGKLQGFIGYAFVDKETGVDGFSFPEGISRQQQYKQFGNSVSIPVIRSMAEFMARYL